MTMPLVNSITNHLFTVFFGPLPEFLFVRRFVSVVVFIAIGQGRVAQKEQTDQNADFQHYVTITTASGYKSHPCNVTPLDKLSSVAEINQID